MESARAELLAFLSKADPMDWRWGIYDEGGQRRLGQAAVNAVGTILESYQGWRAPETPAGLLEVFAPSLHHRRETERWMPDPDDLGGATAHYDRWLTEILHLSLFVDRIWIPDPAEILARALDDVIRPKISVHNFLADPREAALAMQALEPLEPLVRAGVVSYYPPHELYHTVVSFEMFGEYRDFSEDQLATAWPELFVAEGLQYASVLGASYAALVRDEFEALKRSAQELGERAGLIDAGVVAALPEMKLPYFDNISPELLVAVRKDAEAFEDFRNMLRETIRTLPGGADSPQFDKEVKRLEQQVLSPAIKKLQEEVRGIAHIRGCLSSAGIDFAAGALAGFVTTGNVLAALPAGAVTVLTKTLVKLLATRPQTRAAGRVILAFYTGRTPSAGLLPSL